jgi:mRNA-degrading endonuclease RelE of RelBE toxin-antitoxin system
MAVILEAMIAILETDPYNRTHQHDIIKLTGVRPGMGRWRIRQGDYRLRYDIFRRAVVMYSIRHRSEAY